MESKDKQMQHDSFYDAFESWSAPEKWFYLSTNMDEHDPDCWEPVIQDVNGHKAYVCFGCGQVWRGD